ncbi:MAG: hypothetical protein AMR96_02210 [Candidatus Adiutrix intracellularis]|nr:MAG: hypothetical protein AMR96_02210 [Candidatus Adiutrix intracellularis]
MKKDSIIHQESIMGRPNNLLTDIKGYIDPFRGESVNKGKKNIPFRGEHINTMYSANYLVHP